VAAINDQPLPLAYLLAGHDAAERRARLRESRALVTVYFGPGEIRDAFDKAVDGDDSAVDRALPLLAAAPAIRRRRTLATYLAMLR
jgi:hypothetical protein